MDGGEYARPKRKPSKAYILRHIMTGVGAYYYIVWGIYLRHCLNYRHDEYELFWPNLWTVPVVVKRHGPSANGYSNGSLKKGV